MNGVVSNAVSEAQALLNSGDTQRAAELLSEAAAKGDALAARELATWLLEGRLVRRNLAQARGHFERAAELGDRRASEIVRAFIAGGVGGRRDWLAAVELLRGAAGHDAAARNQLNLIAAMSLDTNGDPQAGFEHRPLSDSPDVRLFPSFFSAAECEYLIALASPSLRPSVVVDPYSGRQIPNPIRTSSGTGFPFVDENPAVHALNRRIAAASGSDVRSGEPLQVLSYAPGQQYREHSDALPGAPSDQQRVLTFLVYLDEDYDGGETLFPAVGLRVRGRKGDGLLFRNAAADGTPDPRALHAGLPVTRGIKHIASRWIRAAPLVLE